MFADISPAIAGMNLRLVLSLRFGKMTAILCELGVTPVKHRRRWGCFATVASRTSKDTHMTARIDLAKHEKGCLVDLMWFRDRPPSAAPPRVHEVSWEQLVSALESIVGSIQSLEGEILTDAVSIVPLLSNGDFDNSWARRMVSPPQGVQVSGLDLMHDGRGPVPSQFFLTFPVEGVEYEGRPQSTVRIVTVFKISELVDNLAEVSAHAFILGVERAVRREWNRLKDTRR